MPMSDEERVARPRTVRVSDERWAEFSAQVALSEDTRNRVINQFIAWYDREPRAQLPQRPPAD